MSPRGADRSADAPQARPCPADLDRGLRAQLTAGCVVDRAEYARYEARPPPCRRPPGSPSPSTKIRGTRPSRVGRDGGAEPLPASEARRPGPETDPQLLPQPIVRDLGALMSLG